MPVNRTHARLASREPLHPFPIHHSPSLRRVRYAALCNLYLYSAIGACAPGLPLRSPKSVSFLISDAKLPLFFNIYVNVNAFNTVFNVC